jgi:hypothetical protein
MTKSDKEKNIHLIINEIKSYLGYKTDTELADFLGTTQSNIATWKKRQSINYDLIIAKCPNIDANWLITGKGNMLKKDNAEKSINQSLDGNNNYQMADSNMSIGENNELAYLRQELAEYKKLLAEKDKQINNLIGIISKTKL